MQRGLSESKTCFCAVPTSDNCSGMMTWRQADYYHPSAAEGCASVTRGRQDKHNYAASHAWQERDRLQCILDRLCHIIAANTAATNPFASGLAQNPERAPTNPKPISDTLNYTCYPNSFCRFL